MVLGPLFDLTTLTTPLQVTGLDLGTLNTDTSQPIPVDFTLMKP
jgi:hypothetical protein